MASKFGVRIILFERVTPDLKGVVLSGQSEVEQKVLKSIDYEFEDKEAAEDAWTEAEGICWAQDGIQDLDDEDIPF